MQKIPMDFLCALLIDVVSGAYLPTYLPVTVDLRRSSNIRATNYYVPT